MSQFYCFVSSISFMSASIFNMLFLFFLNLYSMRRGSHLFCIFFLSPFSCLWQSYQIICEKYPSFRERSENVDLVVEISLQPWHVFKPDGVCGFSTTCITCCLCHFRFWNITYWSTTLCTVWYCQKFNLLSLLKSCPINCKLGLPIIPSWIISY